ncbi:MAG: hypothetical protein J6K01_06690 [Paludibacteraceae bacterium]|nr:hypothetical protein [Paludibacteraceae bacterium]
MAEINITGTSNSVPPVPSPTPSRIEPQRQTIGPDKPVTIVDDTTPILCFFGPPQCGKTMSIVRLARYLYKKGYKIKPIRSFLPADDEEYESLCDNFNDIMFSSEAQPSTPLFDFMLVGVYDERGNNICQILEAPGEGYFDPDDLEREPPFRRYVNTVINCPNRKLWIIMVEPDWKGPEMRARYVERIKYLHKEAKSLGNFLFLYNKIDKTQFEHSHGVNESAAIKNVKKHYPGIFEPFRIHGILGLFGGYDCEFVPFKTGTYYKYDDGGKGYDPSSDIYPRSLWNKIKKYL